MADKRKLYRFDEIITKVPEPKPGPLTLTGLFSVSLGCVVGSGLVTLIGPAMSYTGYSVWLAYLVAILMGIVMTLPIVVTSSCVRVGGAFYSLASDILGPRFGGVIVYATFFTPVLYSGFCQALGMYLHQIFPQFTAQQYTIACIIALLIINLFGLKLFDRISKTMATLLLITMSLYIVWGLLHINQPLFDFSGKNMFSGGSSGFVQAVLLLVTSCQAYYTTIYYGKDARRATCDIPKAMLLTIPCIIMVYCGLAMVSSGVLPFEEVSGSSTILPAAQHLLPNILYILFFIGGPLMAIITTINPMFNNLRYGFEQATIDGWFPKSLMKHNRYGMPWIIYLVYAAILLIPNLLGLNIVMITNIYQFLSYFTYMTVIYCAFRIPSRYPDAFKQNLFHLNKPAMYVICTLSAIAYTIVFIKAAIKISPICLLIAIIFVIVVILVSNHLIKNKKLHIVTSVWPSPAAVQDAAVENTESH
ncbi:APC family permease [Caproicibacterium sp. NSD3]